ncbi:MAG: type II toxin-antitoxin system RelE/ParE family toxin [Drouetiella hepatica Uher 2000/2452]|uniref:Type II toxin-antitoxin system RelE/ParE family toxin n=1 Tax=Drouetiella hepatica Uher 2000/2452 TaxID=904376 RepID=A0A951QBW2_9CYAN|nr:type II toxin-antitoxin system RelE/ParE family toxin [Drouetiella hepatica Uher 2000/2452]
MEAQPREVILYVTADDTCPFELWLNALRDRQARARIKKRLDRIELGNLGDFKPVGEGVMELRIDYGSGYRVYFAQAKATTVLLLCGGDKSTQDQDIYRAKQYWADFQKRQNANP